MVPYCRALKQPSFGDRYLSVQPVQSSLYIIAEFSVVRDCHVLQIDGEQNTVVGRDIGN